MDWNKIKAEYIAGGTSYRKLADKYGVDRNKIQKKATSEHWVALQSQAKAKAESKMIDAISGKNAIIDDTYYRLVDKLMQKAEKYIDTTEIWQPTSLKDMATTLKYLKECKGVKSEIDLREQEARIKNLEKQAAENDNDDDKPSGVLILPSIIETPTPPEEDSDGQ